MNTKHIIDKLNPAVSREWLLLLAGVMWSGVGLMLGNYAWHWWMDQPSMLTVGLVILGVALAVLAYRALFRNIAGKNIDRIQAFDNRTCIFAFQAWKGYLIIGIMVPGGLLLRHSSFPKEYLAVIYATIGGALFLSSIQYYAALWKGWSGGRMVGQA